jgi:hypothetical protein
MERRAFTSSGRIQTSRSFVARTQPWAARACAPTIRNSTLWALNSANRSLKSWFEVSRVLPHQAETGEFPNGVDSFLRRRANPCPIRLRVSVPYHSTFGVGTCRHFDVRNDILPLPPPGNPGTGNKTALVAVGILCAKDAPLVIRESVAFRDWHPPPPPLISLILSRQRRC